MLDILISLDIQLTTFISNLLPHNSLFDIIFAFLSLEGMSIYIWIVMIIFFVYILNKKNKSFIPAFLLSYISTHVLVNYILKNIFLRPRPWVAQGLEEALCPENFSFPSGHASGAFAGAVIFARFDPKRRWLYYSLAILISLSRIYLICHYVLDVVFGALIGYLIGKLVLHYITGNKKLKDVA